MGVHDAKDNKRSTHRLHAATGTARQQLIQLPAKAKIAVEARILIHQLAGRVAQLTTSSVEVESMQELQQYIAPSGPFELKRFRDDLNK